MKLKCYAVKPNPPAIIPARPDRRWMDDFPSQHAYRCLPLTIANTFGWELLSPGKFSIHWNGGPDAENIQFQSHDDFPDLSRFAVSNFTRGIVTFHTSYIFRTDPGWDLIATASFNEPKDGIAPLTGIIETDWLPYPFTMNWQLTRPGEIHFEKDEPFCRIIPIPKRMLEEVEPEIHALDSQSDLTAQYTAWREKRADFMTAFRAGDPDTLRQAWQKYYFKGELPTADEPIEDHLQKLRLATPTDLRPPAPANLYSSAIVSANTTWPD